MKIPEKYIFLLFKRRIVLFAIIALVLFVGISIFSVLFNIDTNPALYTLFFLFSSVVINIIAASLWYSLLEATRQIENADPLYKVFPCFKDRSNKVYIIMAAVPSVTGHITTGIGEARALGMLLEKLKDISFPIDSIEVDYASNYTYEEVINIVSNYNIILLGGPNFNMFTAYIFQEFHNKFPYVFLEDMNESKSMSKENSQGVAKRYSGVIVKNTMRHEAVTSPKPNGVMRDTEVEFDCGLIIRLLNEAKKSVTIIAGGMTSGVWISTKIMTEYDTISMWHPYLKSEADKLEYSIVFEAKVKNVLSVNNEDIKILKKGGLYHEH